MTRAEDIARLKWPARLIFFGLVIEFLSLFGLYGPFGFMIFSTLGVTSILAGVLLFVGLQITKPTPGGEA